MKIYLLNEKAYLESHKSCYQNQRDVVLSLQLKKDFEGHVRVKMIMVRLHLLDMLSVFFMYLFNMKMMVLIRLPEKKAKKKKIGTGP